MTEIELLDRKQAAAFLRISDRTLDRISEIPRLIVGKRRILFRRADLLAYVEQAAAPAMGRAA